MEAKSPSFMKAALNIGAVIGLALIALTLIIYLTELYDHSWPSYIILIAGLYIGTKKYRDGGRGGYISYGQALGFGVLLSLFSSIILAFFLYIYLGYVDDSPIQYGIEKMETELYNQGQMTDEQIEQAIEMGSKFMKPGIMSVMVVLSYTFIGFIVSLITSAFLKKENEEPFDESEE